MIYFPVFPGAAMAWWDLNMSHKVSYRGFQQAGAVSLPLSKIRIVCPFPYPQWEFCVPSLVQMGICASLLSPQAEAHPCGSALRILTQMKLCVVRFKL